MLKLRTGRLADGHNNCYWIQVTCKRLLIVSGVSNVMAWNYALSSGLEVVVPEEAFISWREFQHIS